MGVQEAVEVGKERVDSRKAPEPADSPVPTSEEQGVDRAHELAKSAIKK